MSLKGSFKDSSFVVQVLLSILLIVTGFMVASFIASALIFAKTGFSTEAFLEVVGDISQYPSSLREMQFFLALGTFIFPALLLAYLFSDNQKAYLQADTPVFSSVAIWTVLGMLLAVPALNFTLFLNQQLTLPESLKGLEDWMIRSEEEASHFIESMLYAENLWALIFNIVVIAIFAGVGEEFMFRGVVQNILRKITQNEHLIIWVAAVIFSAIHLQFYGFLPRLLLGAYFGYLLLYTKNIWIPVLAHFTNNFFGVIISYIYQDTDQLKELDTIGTGDTWWLAVVSLSLWGVAFWLIRKKSLLQNLSS